MCWKRSEPTQQTKDIVRTDELQKHKLQSTMKSHSNDANVKDKHKPQTIESVNMHKWQERIEKGYRHVTLLSWWKMGQVRSFSTVWLYRHCDRISQSVPVHSTVVPHLYWCTWNGTPMCSNKGNSTQGDEFVCRDSRNRYIWTITYAHRFLNFYPLHK